MVLNGNGVNSKLGFRCFFPIRKVFLPKVEGSDRCHFLRFFSISTLMYFQNVSIFGQQQKNRSVIPTVLKNLNQHNHSKFGHNPSLYYLFLYFAALLLYYFFVLYNTTRLLTIQQWLYVDHIYFIECQLGAERALHWICSSAPLQSYQQLLMLLLLI